MRTAEIISIGDELTSGARLDTNSQWLSRQFSDLGIRTLYHTTVGDSLAAKVRAFREAAERADVIVSTGGLGPTQDDLTRQSLAEAFAAPLELRPAALKHIEALFASRGRTMAERNRLQAMFPQGSKVIENPNGTAPGIHLTVVRDEREAANFFALPGVPAEMREMWAGTVRPWLLAGASPDQPVIRRRVLKCFGVGESELEQKIEDLTRRDRNPLVGITVSHATLSLRIEATAATAAAADEMLAADVSELKQRLGRLVFGEGDEYELPDAVLDLLGDRGESLCCLEIGDDSVLDGWLSSRERPEQFKGCLSLATEDAIDSWHQLLQASRRGGGPVGDKLEQFLRPLAAAFQADWVLAVKSYPALSRQARAGRPLPSTAELAIGNRESDHVETAKIRLGGHPEIIRTRLAKAALDLLRHQLINRADHPESG